MPRRVLADALAAFDALIESGDTVAGAARQVGISEATARRRVREGHYPEHHARVSLVETAVEWARTQPCLTNDCPRTAEVPSKGVCHAHYKMLRKHGRYEWARPGLQVRGTRDCRVCGESKPITDFPMQQNRPGQRGSRCKPCGARNKASQGYDLRARAAKYGLSEDDYRALVVAQRGVCAICGFEPRPGHALAIDHCHSTGAVRGLLCRGCNIAIGHMRDDPRRFESAAVYLRERARA